VHFVIEIVVEDANCMLQFNRYVVGTEDGNIHKCMCSHTEQYIDSYLRAHAASSLLIEFYVVCSCRTILCYFILCSIVSVLMTWLCIVICCCSLEMTVDVFGFVGRTSVARATGLTARRACFASPAVPSTGRRVTHSLSVSIVSPS